MNLRFFRQFHRGFDVSESIHLPHIGQRILKTTLAVFLCLVIYAIRGYEGQNMPTEAAITAIICMQPYVQDSKTYAVNRAVGTLIGTVCGLLLLLLLSAAPVLGQNRILLYSLMAVGVLIALYCTVLVRMPSAASLAAIVFLCIVIAFPEIEDPIRSTATRILDVFIGTAVAVAVNVFRFPRKKNPNLVFFVRTKDLAPDRFSHIPPAALYRLNSLYNDGAKICLMSEHAPAFFTVQMGSARLNMPMIVMDGAAVYDPHENTYLHAETIPPEASTRVMERLDALGVSYFIYTIHHDKTCIFHSGDVREEEQIVYERMRRSPYRSYLEGEIFEPEEIVYLKVIGQKDDMPALAERLQAVLPTELLRTVIRDQAGGPTLGSLYIYSAKASMEQAGRRWMAQLQQGNPALKPMPILSRGKYRSERDAIHLLHLVENYYEPIRLPKHKTPQKTERKEPQP